MRRSIALLASVLALGALAPALSRGEDPRPKVTIDAEREPLLAVLRKICTAQGMNFVIDAAATDRAGSVSVRLTGVTLEDALASLCDVFDLEARIVGNIVTVKVRPAASAPRETKGPNRFLPPKAEGPAKADGADKNEKAEKPEKGEPLPRETPTPPARPTNPGEGTSEVTTASRPVVQTSGGGALAVGLVVEVSPDSLKLKEASGDPREYVLATDDANRASILQQGLKRLKKGDRVALEYRVDGAGQARIMNLLGGGRP